MERKLANFEERLAEEKEREAIETTQEEYANELQDQLDSPPARKWRVIYTVSSYSQLCNNLLTNGSDYVWRTDRTIGEMRKAGECE